jgi:large subunit ribosomal protein L20
MTRIKRGVMTHKRHKKIFSLTKGYKGLRKNVFKMAKQAVSKAGQNAYRDRKRKKRTFRTLWITRIQAGLKRHNLSYSRFVYNLENSQVLLNRKILSELSSLNPTTFDEVVKLVNK